MGALHRKAHARVGIMGNPSDGFNGKTVAATITNFWAEAWIWPTDAVQLVPNPLYDVQRFTNLRQLSAVSTRKGYSGGMRLMQAVCHRFFKQLNAHPTVTASVDLDKGFALTYHTNVSNLN